MISRHHAMVEVVDGEPILRDLGSKNGTFVNGREVTEPYVLQVNDRIRVGRTLLALMPIEEENKALSPPADHDTRHDRVDVQEDAADRLQINRRVLRNATELTARIGALCKVRHSISAIVSAIRKEFLADCCGVFLLEPSLEPSYVEGNLPVTEANISGLEAGRDSGQWKACFGWSDRGVAGADRYLLVIPLRVAEEVKAVVLLSREESRPFEPHHLDFAETLAECLRVVPLNKVLSEGAPKILPDHLGIVGSSEAMGRVRERIKSYAGTQVTVLIRGESGTGKELTARAIAHLSDRRFGPYIEMNCACLMPELLESELFGHERGAFTGAAARRIGKLELADGGTLFLDEIGELTLDLQAKLLRVLEGQPFYRLGGNDLVNTDVRFICATNRDLEAMVKAGTFRADLYHRINVLSIELPALRKHLEDIPELVPYLISQMQEDLPSAREYVVTPKAFRRLLRHSWPGNVRELQNVLQRIILLSSSSVIDENMIPTEIGEAGESTTLRLPRLQVLTEMIEREEISRALLETKGQKSMAAKMLGISRPTLDKKIKTYNLGALLGGRSREGGDSDQSD